MSESDDQDRLEGLDDLNKERSIVDVGEEKVNSPVARGIVFIVLVLFLVAAAVLAYYNLMPNRGNDTQDPKHIQTLRSSTPARTFTPPPEEEDEPEVAIAVEPVITPVVQPRFQETYQPVVQTGGYSGKNEAPKPKPFLDKTRAGVMAVTGDTSTNNPQFSSTATQSSADEDSGLASALKPSVTKGETAGTLSNRNYLLTKGSFIDCALQTRLDSTVPGMTACIVTRNIFSDNGKVLLVERGSQITGEYSGGLQQGQARIFVLWNRIKTPNGIVINLNSAGTDSLGGAGVSGYIDTHFWERFGGAIMLSLIDDIGRGLANSTNDSDFNLNGSSDSAQDMASEALENSINIPPTLYKNQGDKVGIFVSRDLDFSSVYDVR